jgi:methylmalonyl-CoA/ethylmalonyl-CoA epimerase
MVQMIQSIFKAGFEQVCIVANNLDESAETMWNNFGIGPWSVHVHDIDKSFTEMTYHGQPARFSFKSGHAQTGPFELELIEPLEGDNIYRDFLRVNGEGVQHFRCPKINTIDTYRKTVKDFEKAGFPCLMSARSVYGRFAYIDTTKVLNTMIEIYWRDPASPQPPEPTYYLPKKNKAPK